MVAVSPSALSSYVFAARYSRHRPDLERYETRVEAVDRVIDMHRTFYADKQIEPELAFVREAMVDGLVLGSQRALQFGGPAILRKAARLYNCCASYADRPRFFAEAFWLLLCGCGVGFSVQQHHIAKLPAIKAPGKTSKSYVIPDTIEGWADALNVLLASYGLIDSEMQQFEEFVGQRVHFDYGLIRPKGAPLSSSSGRAPGPLPLRTALEKIRSLLNRIIGNATNEIKLAPIHAYDIVMFAADAVISGGVRRSATLCLFSPNDTDMIKAKTGDWFHTNPQRGRSNNSALLIRNQTAREDFELYFKVTKEFGEPGFIWADSTEVVYNPCVEIALYPFLIEKQKSGWSFCVSGDTKLLTRTGITDIKDAVGKEVEIWNGQSWKKVKPFHTGSDRKLYRVALSDGSFLDCTDNHKWLVKDRFADDFTEVETKDLLSFSRYPISTPRANVVCDDSGEAVGSAYDLGFITGDGSTDERGRVYADLYGKKRDIHFVALSSTTPAGRVYFDIDADIVRNFKQFELPTAIYGWNAESIRQFVAGYADADGSQAGTGIRIYGPEARMRGLQLLLTKIGVVASVNFMDDKPTNFGPRSYAMWYVQVPDATAFQCQRLNTEDGRPARFKGKAQVIRSVVELSGLHETYCLEEPESHTCLFNNVITKQCNLSEVNARVCNSDVKKWERAVEAASMLGTLQAGYTKFDYLGHVSEEIAKRDALLGVSMTGMMDNPKMAFHWDLQRHFAKIVLDVNEQTAVKLGINPASRATCIKPSGTASCLLDTASGIHAHHSRRYLRRAQANELEEAMRLYRDVNPRAVEKSVWNSSGTDYVVTFCVEIDEEAITKHDFGAVQLLEQVRCTQENWVAAGARPDRCVGPVRMHSVSNTINVRDNEWEAVGRYIYDHRASFAGVALLSHSGDLDYPQAPFCAVKTEEELLKAYGSGVFLASGLIVDGLDAFNGDLWGACDAAAGHGTLLDEPTIPDDAPAGAAELYQEARLQRVEWVRRLKQFAERYFGNELRQATYCLKDVHNFKLWLDLRRECAPVDYTTMTAPVDQVIQPDAACAGGACGVSYA